MTQGQLILMVILLLAIVSRNNILATAAVVVLGMQFLRLERYYPLLERRGLELGLTFLTCTVLVSFADNRISLHDLGPSLLSLAGIVAFLGGIAGSVLNGMGLKLLTSHSEVIFSITLGTITGIIACGGIPVGPIMAAGLALAVLTVLGWKP
ncbi:MAG: DUF441 domain-containing protein [Bacillota bacterium]